MPSPGALDGITVLDLDGRAGAALHAHPRGTTAQR